MPNDVLAVDKTLAANQDHWLIREISLYMARVLRRLDLTAKSFFAIVEPESCFAGNLLELLLAADRSYMLNDPETAQSSLYVSEINAGVASDEQWPDAACNLASLPRRKKSTKYLAMKTDSELKKRRRLD